MYVQKALAGWFSGNVVKGREIESRHTLYRVVAF
jgi:hypothetical protein